MNILIKIKFPKTDIAIEAVIMKHEQKSIPQNLTECTIIRKILYGLDPSKYAYENDAIIYIEIQSARSTNTKQEHLVEIIITKNLKNVLWCKVITPRVSIPINTPQILIEEE